MIYFLIYFVNLTQISSTHNLTKQQQNITTDSTTSNSYCETKDTLPKRLKNTLIGIPTRKNRRRTAALLYTPPNQTNNIRKRPATICGFPPIQENKELENNTNQNGDKNVLTTDLNAFINDMSIMRRNKLNQRNLNETDIDIARQRRTSLLSNSSNSNNFSLLNLQENNEQALFEDRISGNSQIDSNNILNFKECKTKRQHEYHNDSFVSNNFKKSLQKYH